MSKAQSPSAKDWCRWLQYSLSPRHLRTLPHPAMLGNGRLEIMADLHRPRVTEAVCYGYGPAGLAFGKDLEEHLVPAVYNAQTGKKYLLSTSPGPGAGKATVILRPDRHGWRYVFDDLRVDVSLILPRLMGGYLLKVELRSKAAGGQWFVDQEIRKRRVTLRIPEAHQDGRGTVWFKSPGANAGEAIGATVAATAVNLGPDGAFFTNIMIRVPVNRGPDRGPLICHLARAYGPTPDEARKNLDPLLYSPEDLEEQTTIWWNEYLNEVPRLETPDDAINKTFLWSWPSFRVNQIDVPVGVAPAGIFVGNNGSLKPGLSAGAGDHTQAGAINLLYDPQIQRELMLVILRNTRKTGLLVPGIHKGEPMERSYPSSMASISGLLHKYVLTTGDIALLNEDIGGISLLQRLEEALEAQLAYRDDQTGLFRTDNELPTDANNVKGFSGGFGPNQENVTRFRGGAGTFYNDTNGVVYGTFLAMAEIEEIAQRPDQRDRYLRLAQELGAAIQQHCWREDLQFFCDVDKEGRQNDYMGIGGFITGLFTNQTHRPGGLATPAQAQRLSAWCSDPDFSSDYGVTSLARRSPYFDPDDNKGYNSSIDMHWCNQIPAGLYAHGCLEEAHIQMLKLFRRLGTNGGLGPRYRGEVYQPDTGEIVPFRFPSYPCILSALTSVIEGAFGLRWTTDGLAIDTQTPWDWASLRNLRIRGCKLDLVLSAGGKLTARIDGREAASSAEGNLLLPWEVFDHK